VHGPPDLGKRRGGGKNGLDIISTDELDWTSEQKDVFNESGTHHWIPPHVIGRAGEKVLTNAQQLGLRGAHPEDSAYSWHGSRAAGEREIDKRKIDLGSAGSEVKRPRVPHAIEKQGIKNLWYK